MRKILAVYDYIFYRSCVFFERQVPYWENHSRAVLFICFLQFVPIAFTLGGLVRIVPPGDPIFNWFPSVLPVTVLGFGLLSAVFNFRRYRRMDSHEQRVVLFEKWEYEGQKNRRTRGLLVTLFVLISVLGVPTAMSLLVKALK